MSIIPSRIQKIRKLVFYYHLKKLIWQRNGSRMVRENVLFANLINRSFRETIIHFRQLRQLYYYRIYMTLFLKQCSFYFFVSLQFSYFSTFRFIYLFSIQTNLSLLLQTDSLLNIYNCCRKVSFLFLLLKGPEGNIYIKSGWFSSRL